MLSLYKKFFGGNNQVQNQEQDQTQNFGQDQEGQHGSRDIIEVSNWYQDRYNGLVVQRNLLLVTLLLSLVIVLTAIIVVMHISDSRKFDPFVIQVEKNTGLIKIAKAATSTSLTTEDAITRFLIRKYVTARETYNPVDFSTTARKTVSLMSTSNIYRQFISYIRKDENDPTISYAGNTTTYLRVRSWSKLSAKQYILRFSINEVGDTAKSFNKIALIGYDYVDMNLSDDDPEINPAGFQVNSYKVDDDNS